MTRIVFGGCVYRSMVHAAHAASLANLASLCAFTGTTSLVDVVYQHTSNLPQGRSLWLRRVISIDAEYAVSLDSDTSFSPMELLDSLPILIAENAIGIAPVIRRTERGVSLNIFHAPGQTFAPSSCGGGHPPLWAGGFGLAVFSLEWFRRNWDKPYPEPFGDKSEWINQGEDTQMCRSVIRRRGHVVPLWIPTTHFDSSGSVIIGAQTGYRDGRMVVQE